MRWFFGLFSPFLNRQYVSKSFLNLAFYVHLALQENVLISISMQCICSIRVYSYCTYFHSAHSPTVLIGTIWIQLCEYSLSISLALRPNPKKKYGHRKVTYSAEKSRFSGWKAGFLGPKSQLCRLKGTVSMSILSPSLHCSHVFPPKWQ
jgi:hypothetical protein